jgi:hypothetical protein
MAITYPVALPTTTGIAMVTLSARNVVGLSQSPFTMKQQVQKHAGQRWEAQVQLPPMDRDEAEVWLTFLMKMNGVFGTFLLGDPNGGTARGSASTTPGTPVVNGASQTGNELDIDGLPASATGYLKAGDYIQLGSGSSAQLYKVLDDVDSNASGEATLTIWPNLRSSPDDDATVVVSSAQGVFRLADNQTDITIDTASIYGLAFQAIEAL